MSGWSPPQYRGYLGTPAEAEFKYFCGEFERCFKDIKANPFHYTKSYLEELRANYKDVFKQLESSYPDDPNSMEVAKKSREYSEIHIGYLDKIINNKWR